MCLSTVVLAAIIATAAPAFAGPDGANVVGGAATVSGQGGAAVIVNQSSDRAIINWNTFNVGVGESARFNQPSAGSITLNRVTGGLGPSQINGSVTANGRIFLINRDGILFGPTATVDTAGFLATTHDIRNDDFMAGRFTFGIPGNPQASIVNQGTITAHNSGFAALVAPGVRNSGTITATLGTVSLASGNGFTLDFYGDRLITLGVTDSIAANVIDVATGQPLSSLVKNEGTLRANGGRVEMTAATARRVVDSVINNTGTIEANTFRRRGGTIVLSAGTGATKVAGAPKQTIRLSGTLSASAKKKGKGGKIVVTAENIEVVGARIDASGKRGGGTVLIGGDWSGGHPIAGIVSNPSARLESAPVATASTVSVDGASIINASATQSGNGGKVIVWSDQTTTFAGTILARGGATGGDGGFVETSGHQVLNFTGNVDTRAPNGVAGTLLLDPFDVTISNGATTGGPFSGSTYTPSANSSVLNAAELSTQLQTSNVVVTTGGAGSAGAQNGDITVAAQVSWSSNTTLTLSAFRNIQINGLGVNGTIKNTGAGSLILRADNTGTGIGTVSMPPSTFSTRADWTNSSGTVTVYYNPTSYTSPTDFTAGVGGTGRIVVATPSQLTAYMLVNTVANLNAIGTNASTLGEKYAIGPATLNASGFTGYAPGTTFTGVLDGNGGLGVNSTISNLTLSGSTSPIGLFPFIGSTGIVRNLVLDNVSITAAANTMFIGVLAGENDGTISNVQVKSTTASTVNGGSFNGIIAGGLVGQNTGTITLSQSAANVTVGNAGGGAGQGNAAGGLVGNNLGTITQSSASGTIGGGTSVFVGGLVGRNDNFGSGPGASISNSSASGNVSVASGTAFSSSAGGLVGFNGNGIITNSSASGNVTVGAFAMAGGLVGQNEGLITQSSYSTGTVSGSGSGGLSDSIGGLVGDNAGTVRDSSAIATVTGTNVSAGGLVGRNTGTIVGTAAGLTFANATVTVGGDQSAGGGLVGNNDVGGSIQNTSATGTIGRAPGALATDLLKLGGLVGQNSGAVGQSTAAVLVTLGFGSGGGLVGENGGTITLSSASGAVSGTGNGSGSAAVGGLVGLNFTSGQIANSSATGNVSSTGFAHLGGLIGDNSASLANLTAGNTVNASGPSVLAGGLIGANGATLTNVQAFGNVTVTGSATATFAGGLVGSNFGTVIGSSLPAANASCTSGASFSCASGAVSVGAFETGGGLVGFNQGNITSAFASGAVSGAAGSSLSAQTVIGGLVGVNLSATITGAHATGTVTGQDFVAAGGFVGQNVGAIVNSYASGNVTGAAFANAGGLVGVNGFASTGISITSSFATGNVSITGSNATAGGLVGMNFTGATIANSQAFGKVSATPTGQGNVLFSDSNETVAGGLVGKNSGTVVGTTPVSLASSCAAGASFSCATGMITVGSGNIGGGLVGSNEGTVTQAFAAGNIGTVGVAYLEVGGLVGENTGIVQRSFAIGTVRAGDFSLAGGLVGGNFPCCSHTGVVVRIGLISGSGASGNVSVGASSYGGGLAGVGSATIENSIASGVVMGGANSDLGGLVGLAAIDTGVVSAISNSSASGAVTSTGPGSFVGGLAGWSGGMITQSSATGAVAGNGASAVGGLVGFNNSGATITSSSASGPVTGGAGAFVGGLVGENEGTIAQSSASGAIAGTGAAAIGGLVGSNDAGGTIANSVANGSVTGDETTLFTGGFVGINSGMIDPSSAGGAVTGGANSVVGGFAAVNVGTITQASATGAVIGGDGSIVGGLVAENLGQIAQSFATGTVTGGANSIVGGLVGFNAGIGSAATVPISASHATGNVTGGDNSVVGGFFGINLLARIDHSYATGTVTGGIQTTAGGFGGLNLGTVNVAFASGPVTGGNNSFVGGFVGVNYAVADASITTPTGVITQAYAFGPTTGGTNSFVAAFAAINVGSLDQTLASGFVTAGAGSTTGGLVASNTLNYVLPASVAPFIDPPGTATNSYWDTQSTGQPNSAGGTGESTAQLVSGLPAGFDPAVWAISAGQSYPFLKDPAPSPTPTPSSIPPVEPLPPTDIATLLAGTPIYPTQQLNDQWRDPNTTPTVQAALVTPPSPPAPRPSGRPNGNGNPPLNGPRVSGVPPVGETRFIQDQVVFRVCGDVPAARVELVARRLGMTIISSQRVALIDCTVYQYRITDRQSVSDKIRRLEALRLIAAAQPNYVFALAQAPPALAQVPPPPTETPPAPEGDPAQYFVAKLRLPEVHRIARGTGVKVAVIDSEIDGKHPDLEGTILSRFDAVGAEDKPHPHGTGMAGAIVSHKRLIGVAPGVQVLAVHAFGAASTGGQGTSMQIVKGLDWAVSQGARIVNMSFAGPKDPMLQQAIKNVHDKGIVLFAAAGNAGPKSPPLYPGADPNVIAVTATDADDKSYTGANRGRYVAIAAPGVDVLVPAPDGTYQLTTGTSVATAEVSGVAALLIEKDPKLTPDEIRSILTSTAKMLGTKTRDAEFGYGLVDPYKALTSITAKQTSLEPAREPMTAAAR